MRKASPGITPEGLPVIFLCALAALLFAMLDVPAGAGICFALVLFSCHFFRDPERVASQRPGLAVSPADGKIVKIADMPDPFSGKPRQCVCVFMNVFSVHVNRSPIKATVREVAYHPGKFINASLDKASTDNERCAYGLTDEDGGEWSVVQIAGLIARRIVCRVDEGDALERGQRFGMIKFGSRVDIYMPEGYTPAVALGQQVFAGQTVLARRVEAAGEQRDATGQEAAAS